MADSVKGVMTWNTPKIIATMQPISGIKPTPKPMPPGFGHGADLFGPAPKFAGNSFLQVHVTGSNIDVRA